MSKPSGRAEECTCARCGVRTRHPLTTWPDGRVCRNCIRLALLTRGTCPGCGADRLLPGRRDGARVCRDCAGIRRDYHCARCGTEALPHTGRICGRCALIDRLAQLLDDGTGRIAPALEPVAELLANTVDAEATLHWLGRRSAPVLLAELAAGQLELSHAALDARAHPRATSQVRGVLLAAGVLPAVDPVLLDYQRWLDRRLDLLAEHSHHRLLLQFGRWHQLSRMRTKASTRPLAYGALVYAQHQFTAAESFLTWLADNGRHPSTLTQTDLDTWLIAASAVKREKIRGLLTWAMTNRHLPVLHVPVPTAQPGPGITQQQRLDLLRRCANDHSIALSTRVIGCLLLLYAQPLTRIRVLCLTDITQEPEGGVYIRLGEPPSPVPEPFAGLLLELAANRKNLTIAANTDTTLLFPGQRPAQPIHYIRLVRHLKAIGLPAGRTRVAALRQLVKDIPAPVVATALGFHHTTTHRQSVNAGAIWSRYASGEHQH